VGFMGDGGGGGTEEGVGVLAFGSRNRRLDRLSGDRAMIHCLRLHLLGKMLLATAVALIMPSGAKGQTSLSASLQSIAKPDSFSFLRPYDINNHGQIVGEAFHTDGRVLPFLYSDTDGFQVLELLNPQFGGSALSINDYGTIVGNEFSSVSGPDSLHRMTLWSGDGQLERNTGFGINGVARGHGINNAGVALGFDGKPFTWTETNGNSRVLPDGTSIDAYAYHIKDDGTLLGHSGSRNQEATIWPGGTGRHVLQSQFGTQEGRAWDINTSGTIVGSLRDRAVVWSDMHAVPSEIGVGGFSAATSITEGGLVLGHTRFSQDDSRARAFIWSKPTGILDVLQIVPEIQANEWHWLSGIEAVNDKMQAVGWGSFEMTNGDIEDRMFVLTIPTPGVLLLLLPHVARSCCRRRSR